MAKRNDPTRLWSVQDALDTYGVAAWGKGYFGVGENGHVLVHPDGDSGPSIDMKELVDQLRDRGIRPPVLLRFSDVLRHRLGRINEAFRKAIRENEYRGRYVCVYPVKVNQQRHVVEEIRDYCAEYGFGLEAGSKPELLAVLALTADHDMPVVCNGFKDDEYIETVVLAQKLGQEVLPVVEKFSELRLIAKYAEAHGVRPDFGIRLKLTARGAGRWELSGGARSKFGLSVPEVIEAVHLLRSRGMLGGLRLLHFHLGSQITNIRSIKNAVTELTRVYVELRKAGAESLDYLDVGGGLGVDYDGSQTTYESSINYTLEEYASDVVFRVQSICDEEGVEHPTIVSESGRATVAYHSALVFDVLGISRFDQHGVPDGVEEMLRDEETPTPLFDLWERLQDLTHRNCIEYYHDGLQAFEEAMNLFKLGYMSLEQRGVAERLFWALLGRVETLLRSREHVPEELRGLPDFLADTYFCNFSIFQSMPDSWAVDHLFPIMPIHRLREQPDRLAILGDITCDSDGKISHFTHDREDKHALELHSPNGEPYYLAAFLLGAYQEILGDLHNLLGDTHAVHVSLGEDGTASIDHVVEGDTAADVLGYVQYSAGTLLDIMRRRAGRAVEEGRLSAEEADRLLRFYESGLTGYTYLEDSL